MNAVYPQHKELGSILKDEIEHVSLLKESLCAETKILEENDPQALNEITERKQWLVNTIAELDEKRSDLLRNAGYSADPAGTEAFISNLADTDSNMINPLWQELLKLTADCQRQNIINGSIIGNSLRHFNQAIALLTGQDTNAETYSPSGSTSSPTQQSRTIKV